MKLLRLLRSYFRGIRGAALVLSAMMTMAVFLGVLTYSRLEYIVSDYDVFSSNTLEDAYYVQSFETDLQALLQGPVQLIRELEQDPTVDQVLSIAVATPLNYKGYGISIILYDPELIDAFPKLKKLGIDFSKNPDGCLLGSRRFFDLKNGGQIQLNFPRKQEESPEIFAVAGHLDYPYKHISFDTSSTNVFTSDLFQSNDLILMLKSDELMARLEEIADVSYQSNFIVSLKPGLSEAEHSRILDKLNSGASAVPLDEILEHSADRVARECKTQLPRPLFLLLAATVAYLSNVVLIIKKKEGDLAVWHLCGGGRAWCTGICALANALIALPPLVLNCLFVALAPELEWRGLLNLEGMFINSSACLLVLGYYLLTLAISVTVTVCSMRRHTPLTFLRGAAS